MIEKNIEMLKYRQRVLIYQGCILVAKQEREFLERKRQISKQDYQQDITME
ncbi:MAG: hypothetical protein Q7U64_10935 [Desulfocapsaceae bacterium]|nr:hypothetical protein [Desulfocapsaceae bacterium]